ncbi:proline-rich protein 18 [Astyanax mexicanus]|uniref:proline-rich protein 18 n=1 Tax=Astyanax mexicanus TaxID=7994 RepID=UPI0020CAEB03|nr:proline-rich protein 18 [Astyanax mexicanus]
MPFPPINLHSRISSPGKELFRKKKPSSGVVPPQSMLIHKPRADKDMEKEMEKEEVERERERLGTSWPASNNLKQLARKQHQHHHQHHQHHQEHPQYHQQVAKTSTDSVGVVSTEHGGKGSSWVTVAKPLGSSCESVPRSSSGESAAASSSAAPRGSRHSSRASLGREEAGEQEVRFSLSLTPEAVLVIQKRNLEKQMLAKQQKCCGSSDFRHRRVFPSKRAAQSGSKSSAGQAAAVRPDAPGDISAIVKISLLNDQHKYDDVEYEEEDGDVDETVMRKCKEWLKGVESAAAFSKVDSKLAALPHLKSC